LVLYWTHLCMKCSLGISNFLEEISRLSHSMLLLLLLLSSFSHVWLCATPWTVAYQAPPSMGFSRQEYWSGVPSPSMSHSIVVLYFFALITEEGFLISPCYSLELCIQLNVTFLFFFCLSLLFFSQLFVRPPYTTILHFCITSSWGWFWSLPRIQCYGPPPIVLQTPSIRSNPLNLFVISTV